MDLIKQFDHCANCTHFVDWGRISFHPELISPEGECYCGKLNKHFSRDVLKNLPVFCGQIRYK